MEENVGQDKTKQLGKKVENERFSSMFRLSC
jgi:hypothetical protein